MLFACYYLSMDVPGIFAKMPKASAGYLMMERDKKMKNEKKSKENKVSFGKLLAWSCRSIALGSATIVIGYLSMYCTNMMGMSAALVGTLLMASKIFDGVTDLFAGWLVDNTHTKLGKGRPFELCLIGVWVCMYLLFAMGVDWSMGMKCVWIFILYTLIFSVFSTLMNAAETPYMVRAFENSQVITKVASWGGIIITLGSMVVSVSFPIMVGRMGQTPAGWRMIMMIYAIPLTVIGLFRFLFIKEIYEPKTEKSNTRLSIRDILTVLKSTKYIWFFAIAMMIPQTIKGMSVATYYFANVVGDISKYSVIQGLSIVAMVALAIVPLLSKKFMPMQIIMYGFLVGIAGCLINLFANTAMPLLVVGSILTGIATVPCSYLRTPVIMQIADYNESKGKPRMEGTIASAANFMGKIGNALGAFILGLLLDAGGYDGTLAVQPASAVMSIRIAYSIVPAVFMLICVVCAFLYQPLNKFTRELNEAKKAQEAQ